MWSREVEAVRAWRRPLWPLIAFAIVVFLLATITGLLLGGYLPIPSPLRPAADWVWARWN
jgi:hypothetical protein